MDTDERMRQLRYMKLAATGLVVVMIALFAGAQWLEPVHPLFGYVRAFAEAGIAGGLADWFAITALFRRPLGLPLPHTAIVPRNKHRIAENLGQFFERNFLSQEVVAVKLANVDLAAPLMRWTMQQAEQIADYLVALVPNEIDQLDNEMLDAIARDAIAAQLREIDLSTIAQRLLVQLTQGIDYDSVIVAALDELGLLVDDNRDVIRHRVRNETGWILQRMSVDVKVTDAVIKVLDDALNEVRSTPDHPWRRRLGALAHEQLLAMGSSPAYRAQWEALRNEALESEAFVQRIGALRRDLLEKVRLETRSPRSVVRRRLCAAVEHFVENASRDQALCNRLNARAREAILDTVPALRHELGLLISDTVSRWDTATVTWKIELEVGRDLQFVRINGTLIGGLVGLVLHLIGALR